MAASFHMSPESYRKTMVKHLNTVEANTENFPVRLLENFEVLGNENQIPEQITEATELADESVKTLLDNSFDALNASMAEITEIGQVKSCNLTRENVDQL